MGFIRGGPARETGAAVSVPLRGMGFITEGAGRVEKAKEVSVPLRGMGFIVVSDAHLAPGEGFRPLTGHGFHPKLPREQV